MSFAAENTRFTRHIARRFAESDAEEFGLHQTFGAMEANGVVVVVARSDSDKAEELRHFVRRTWGGYIDQPRPR